MVTFLVVDITVPSEIAADMNISLNSVKIDSSNYTVDGGIITINTANLTGFISDGKLVVGKYNLSVNYTSNEEDRYASNYNSAIFEVFKAQPEIIVTPNNINYAYNETVTVNLTSYNATGKMNITITNSSGQNVYQKLSQDLDNNTVRKIMVENLEPGTYNVTVKYYDDANYIDTTIVEKFTVSLQTITIKVDRKEIYVTEYMTISGNVLNGDRTPVSEGKVNITLSNGTSYLLDINESDGSYNTTNCYLNNGTYIATATYILFDKEIVSNEVSFEVNKIPTKTEVTIINRTVENVTVKVTVSENVEGDNSNPGYHNIIKDGFIRVTENNIPKEQEIDGTTTLVLNITLDNVESNTVPVTVDYLENWKYCSSTGIDTSTNEDLNEITVDPIGSNVTIIVTPNPQNITKNVTIYGKVYTDLQSEITNGTVEVIVDNKNLGEYQLTNDGYTLNYTTDKSGEIDVIVHYLGKKIEGEYIILESINYTTFDVNRIPTSTSVVILNNTIGNVTLNVSVAGVDGNTSLTGRVNVTVNGFDVYPVDVDGNEFVVVKLDRIASAGRVGVSVRYEGNDWYLPSDGVTDGEVLVSLDVVSQCPVITVVANESLVYIGDSVNISGNLSDAFGHALGERDVYLNITGRDGLVLVHTDASGSYSFEYLAEFNGTISVVALFNGEVGVYDPVNDSASFVVNKIPTITSIEDVLSAVAGNVTIVVNVTDNDYFAVSEGRVVVVNASDDSHVLGSGGLVDGKVTIRFADVTLPGDIMFNVTYLENDKYLSSRAVGLNSPAGEGYTSLITVTVDPRITIGVDDDEVTIGESVTINGSVFNSTDALFADGNVVVNVNGTEYDAVFDSGLYSLTFVPSMAGNYVANATFTSVDGNTVLVSDNVYFDVNKIPTSTSVTILNNTIGNVTVSVQVTNNTGENVTKGIVRIAYENGTLITDKALTNGETNISMPINTAGELRIIVTYLENDVYLSSIATNESAIGTPSEEVVIINVNKIPTKTNVAILDNTIGNVTLAINVTNETDALVTTGEVIIRNTTNGIIGGGVLENGELIVKLTVEKPGRLEVIVTYPENDIYYSSYAKNNTQGTADNIIVIDVGKIPTKTNVTILNHTIGNVVIHVNVTNMTDDNVITGHVEVYDNSTGKLIGNKTLIDGESDIKLDVTSIGDIGINVKYVENDIYLESNANDSSKLSTDPSLNTIDIDVLKQNASIIINISTDNATIGDEVFIYGTVYDEDGKIIMKGNVTIHINDTDYTTNIQDGMYSLTNVTDKVGKYTVYAFYVGNETVNNATSRNVYFMVNKIPTTTLVNVTNAVVGNVSIDVIVKDNENRPVTSGKLEITTPEKTYDVNVTGEVTPVALDITTTGEVNVEVRYLENDVYLNSSGLDKASYDKNPDNAHPFDHITVIKLNTTITVNVTSPVKAGNSTIIQGVLVDEQNRPISGAEVVVKVDNQIVATVTTIEDGLYTLIYNDTIVGTHNVTSSYGGNDTYIGSDTTTKFDVDKILSEISLDSIEDVPVGNNVNITGKLKDEFNNPIKNATVKITVDDVTHTVTTDEEGNYISSFPTTTVGNKTVTVEYSGNETCDGAKTNGTINVVKQNGTISIVVPEDTKANKPTNITGEITDNEGNSVPNVPVNITVNGKVYPTTTDSDGKYTVEVNNIVGGENNVTATAGTNDKVDIKPAEDKFNATLPNAVITVDPIPDTKIGDNVTITGNLTDEDGNPIPNATVTVVINDESFTISTDENGTYNISVPKTVEGENNVTVIFDSDDYKPATTNTTFNARKSITTVTVEPVNGIVGEDITFTAHIR